MQHSMTTTAFNTEHFLEYLESLGLFRFQIVKTITGFEAILRSSDEPNLTDFTEVRKNNDMTNWVRLSFDDIHNQAITKGFFNKF